MFDRLRILIRMAKLTWATDPLRATVALALTAFDYASPVVSVVGLKWIVEAASTGDGGGALVGVVMLVVTIAAGQGAGFAAFAVGVSLRERVGHRLDLDIASAVASRPDIEHLERPDYLDRLTLLCEQAGNLARLSDSVLQFVGVVVRLGAALVLLASVDLRLLALVVFGLPSLAANVAVERVVSKRDGARTPLQRRAAIIDSYIRHAGIAKEVRIFGAGSELQRRIHVDRVAADNIIRTSNIRIALIESAGWVIFGAGFVVALILVVQRAASGSLDVGQVAMVVALGAQLNSQLGAISTWFGELLAMLRLADHYYWLVSAKLTPAAGDAGRPEGGSLQLTDVGFRYPGTSADVLVGVTLTIPAGSTVAIVGENGAGKTTLVKLLVGLYRPSTGAIKADGVDVTTIDPRSWRLGLSGAFQDTPTLNLRLREVVGIGDVSKLDDDGAISKAISAADALDLLSEMPNGLETELGRTFEGGVQLSSGQWQRLALARAMMRPTAAVLLLDEPTANLDPQAEHAVFERYAQTVREKSGHGGITILVSHRFSTVHMADFIVVLENGHIVEQGNHVELIALDGRYAELLRLQAKGYQ